MDEHIRRFEGLLIEATSQIGREYFNPLVAAADGEQAPRVYRERVYAYELYHQLRILWPAWSEHDPWIFSLGGEVDKKGHPIIRDRILRNSKPDLLAHDAGSMAGNLAVVEIKAIAPKRRSHEWVEFKKDFQKLHAFRSMENRPYAAAYLLVFGANIERVLKYGERFREEGGDLQSIRLVHHPEHGSPARFCDW